MAGDVMQSGWIGLSMDYIGKYRVIKEIGKGATATVYLAVDPAVPGEQLAIKYISFGDGSRDEGKLSRRLHKLMRTEWSVTKQLDHPNIIRIIDTVIEKEYAYLVMEYVDGTTLEPFCSFDNLLPVNRTVGIIFKCCLALDYAYRHGIVHRDIKPANILIDSKDNVKITDFGLAMNVLKNKDSDSTFIMGVGSPSYMSPEQIKSYPLNQKTDLYSLGVVLFHMLTGRLPFRAKSPAQLVYKIINADPPKASLLNPDVPEQMDRVIAKALEKDLYSRYRNGAEMAKDLSGVRYKLLDDNYVPMDMTRFSILRKLSFFTEFEDLDLWEILRIGLWRQVAEGTQLAKQGGGDKRLGIIVEGLVELAIDGKRVGILGPSEPLGAMEYLDSLPDTDLPAISSSAITMSSVTYLEINPAALALASEDCFDRFRTRLTASLVRRLAACQRELVRNGAPEAEALLVRPVGGLELVDIDAPPPKEAQRPTDSVSGGRLAGSVVDISRRS